MSEKKKIFITEDEFIVSRNLEVKLSKLGYEVLGTAASGEEAIQKIRKNPPDLALMDIMLAGEMDGIDTAKIIRDEMDIPVIFLTAYSSEEIYNRAALAEPFAYIIKPFEERELEINIAISLYKHNIEKAYAEKQKQLEELNDNLDKLVEERTEKLLKEIAEKREAQEGQNRFFNIIEQTNDHVVLTDLNGIIEYANPALCEFTGYSREELIGQPPTILKSEIYEDEFFDGIRDVVNQGNEFNEETVSVTKDGKYYTASQSVIPLKDREGKITHYASISRENSKQIEFEKSLTEIQEKERFRISKELHDGLGQSVAAIKLAVNSLDQVDELNQKKMSAINKMLEGLTTSIREISYDLMPSILNDYGLIATFKKNIKQIESTTNIDFNLNNNLNEDVIKPDIRLSLFRIFQEAINNAIKYASAKNITLDINNNLNFVIFNIKDDGIGFDKDKMDVTSRGQGIENMKHRAIIHSGIFSIDSGNGKGTEIKVKIPLNEKD